jgi:4-hydroxybenzoate polyprenyltransferase
MLLIPFGLLSMIYNLPIVHCTNNIVRLRKIPYLKIFLITITWAFVTVMIPARDLGIDIFSRDIGIMFLRRVLFIFALAIPFDIRDAREDKMCNLKTLPVKLGEKKSKFFALIALLIYCIINVIYYFDFKFIPKIGLAFFLCALVAGVFIFISTPFRNKYFFQVGLDGMMILQFILVWGALKL